MGDRDQGTMEYIIITGLETEGDESQRTRCRLIRLVLTPSNSSDIGTLVGTSQLDIAASGFFWAAGAAVLLPAWRDGQVNP